MASPTLRKDLTSTGDTAAQPTERRVGLGRSRAATPLPHSRRAGCEQRAPGPGHVLRVAPSGVRWVLTAPEPKFSPHTPGLPAGVPPTATTQALQALLADPARADSDPPP